MAKCFQDLSSMFWCDVYIFIFEGVFASGTKVILTDSVRCVLCCQSTPILVSRPSLETAPRLSPVLHTVQCAHLPCPAHHTVHTNHVLHITIVHITTSCLQRSTTLLRPWCGCWIYTGCLSLRAVCPLVPRPHLETGSLARQPTQYFAGFLLRISTNSCLLSRSFFLFPFVSLLFSCLRACQCSGTDGRPSILEVGLHHDVPAVLDHGEGEQDHTPSHHASKKVRFGL